ncbi:zinc finger protein 2 homolog isoform X1 [Apis dorsata]|uniref:zinc finger protein 2 homolog isoform X1 n=1 Tax=Apis dorsata TaxID=7462 RepID=UPI0012937FC2|nr:zinc finger protein 2 homolog isoform X1 [Apis dorsata]
MSSLDYLDLCRLCLVKDRVSVPIFEGEGDVRQIFLKIAACLPVKLTREDKLPKKICDDCVYKVELFYQFWNTTANAEKQLLQWLGEVSLEDKQGYVTNVLNPSVMKQEQSTENRLDGNVMQQVEEHQNNMGMGMMDNMGLGIPMIISSANQQQITSVPMDTSSNSVQTIQAVPGPSSQTTHNQIPQNQTNSTQQEDEEESSEDEENSDEECDGDEGLPVKEESEEDPSNRTIEPTTFVNVSLACDEAGPSGLQQQKISDMPEMPIPQPADGDPKSGAKNVKTIAAKPNQSRAPKSSNEEDRSFLVVEDGVDNDSCVVQEEASYRCESCDEEFDTEAALLVHRTERSILRTREALRKAEKKYTCDTCCESFAKKVQLFKHRRGRCKESAAKGSVEGKQHRGKERAVVKGECKGALKEDATSTRQRNPSAQTFYQCEICRKLFRTKNLYEGHLVSHSDARPYQCDICGKSFKRSNTLTVHRRIHTREKNFVCDVCGHAFVQAFQLTIHQRRHFEKYTRYCEICKKGFFTNAELHGHMNVKHGAKEHVCQNCNKSFPNNHSLVKHLKFHDPNFKPVKHQCEFCGKTFVYKNSLVFHVKTHMGENKHTCHLCGKSVSSKGSLQDHLRLHSGEKLLICDICGKAFRKRSTLVVHKRTHTGEKPYSCDTCGKSFTQHSTLVVHKRYHTGQRPYHCEFCTKSFVSRSSLNAHNKVHAQVNVNAATVNQTE